MNPSGCSMYLAHPPTVPTSQAFGATKVLLPEPLSASAESTPQSYVGPCWVRAVPSTAVVNRNIHVPASLPCATSANAHAPVVKIMAMQRADSATVPCPAPIDFGNAIPGTGLDAIRASQGTQLQQQSQSMGLVLRLNAHHPLASSPASSASSSPVKDVNHLRYRLVNPDAIAPPSVGKELTDSVSQVTTAGVSPSVSPVSTFQSLLGEAVPSVSTGTVGGVEQESERMERLPDGLCEPDDVTSAIRLVSLGCYCGPKLCFKKMGRGSETLPFDWLRTRLEGLLHFIRSDFQGFFDYRDVQSVPGTHMTMYRSSLHSFWHDNPDDPNMRDKYHRRIRRFMSIDATTEKVLFVRVLATTDEIPRLGELTTELLDRFGQEARLLCLVPMQFDMVGTAFVQECPGLMLHFLHSDAYKDPTQEASFQAHTYASAVNAAFEWILGNDVEGCSFDSLIEAHGATRSSHTGMSAMGVSAFDMTTPS
mmetsp:Transcript_20456/g.37305  ORF Transcript_20456/g.37305 Transcript_20456/m.37305 type:complete len:479 (+) Transcript_20456:18-1454(+)